MFVLFDSVPEMICSLFIKNAEKCLRELLKDISFLCGIMLLLLKNLWRSYMVTLDLIFGLDT